MRRPRGPKHFYNRKNNVQKAGFRRLQKCNKGRKEVIKNLSKDLEISEQEAKLVWDKLMVHMTFAILKHGGITFDEIATLMVLDVGEYTVPDVTRPGSRTTVSPHKRVYFHVNDKLKVRLNAENPRYRANVRLAMVTKIEEEIEARTEKKKVDWKDSNKSDE